MNNITTQKVSVPNALWFIVPAAGIGQRMGADIPKQYLPLNDSTVLEATLQKLLLVNGVAGIVVAIHPDDNIWPTLNIAQHDQIYTVVGGQSRSDSVLAALDSLNEKLSGHEWVLVHDAARPCIRVDDISHMINTLFNDKIGGILGIPCSDTVKQIDTTGCIAHTLDRSVIWQAQTPQMFRYHTLLSSLHHCMKQGYAVTDEASAVEKMGHLVKMVKGHGDNIKVTHPEDLWLAEAILRRQNA